MGPLAAAELLLETVVVLVYVTFETGAELFEDELPPIGAVEFIGAVELLPIDELLPIVELLPLVEFYPEDEF